jgi:hypothetical protein
VSTSESGNGLQDFLLSLSFRCLCDEPTQHGRRITHPECPVHEKQAFKALLGERISLARKAQQLEVAMLALQAIVALDYRGPRPAEQAIAYETLESIRRESSR